MSDIFSIFPIKTETEFNKKAIDIFNYQYKNILVYKKFIDLLSISIKDIDHYSKIPFMPIDFFKSYSVKDKNYESSLFFQSSGTTSENLSKHHIVNEEIYEKSILAAFSLFFGEPSQYIYLGLLPSYLERKNSSLIYMVDLLMKKSAKKDNGYFLHDFDNLNLKLHSLEKEKKKVILFGVSYALLDFAKSFPQHLENTLIIETGGMKGRKKEITKHELLNELKNGFNTEKVYSEYSMTELLSQAYSIKNNVYQSPSWMKIMIRDIEDPFHYVENGKTGGVNIIDLANIHSCSFISTQDLGKKNDDNSFEILGRIDNSDIRGCSLLLL